MDRELEREGQEGQAPVRVSFEMLFVSPVQTGFVDKEDSKDSLYTPYPIPRPVEAVLLVDPPAVPSVPSNVSES